MKLNTALLGLCIIGTLMTTSCQLDPCSSKRFFIYNHEKIIESVKERADEFTEKDWERKEAKMDQMARDCYPQYASEMSNEEKKDFWMNYLHFNIKRHGKNIFKELEKEAQTWPDEMEEDLSIVLEDPGTDLKNFKRDVYGNEIEKAIDDVLIGFEKVANEIKEWLNDGQ